MKKRIMTILLVLVMLLAMLPTAFAADSNISNWDALKTEIGNASQDASLTIQLPKTLDSSESIIIKSGAQITLQAAEGGTTITRQNNNGGEFVISDGASLTLSGEIALYCEDSLDDSFLTVEAGGTANLNGPVTVEADGASASLITCSGILTMSEGGAVSGYTTSDRTNAPAAIVVTGENANFTMSGGKITGNSQISGSNSVNGGAVQVLAGAQFIMNGGEISGNNVYSGEKPSTVVLGGGVYVNASTMTMNDGEISGNMAARGGGVYLTSGSTFTMTGGKISDNMLARQNSTGSGGGVHIGSGCGFKMESADPNDPAVIEGNYSLYFGPKDQSQAQGGGVYISGSSSSTTTFTMSDAVIRNNRVTINSGTAGGGIYAYSYANVAIKDSEISGNSSFLNAEATGNNCGGGGISIGNNCTLSMTGTTVSGNTGRLGGGLWLDGSGMSVTITSCTIQGNKAFGTDTGNSLIGGGIYYRSSGQTLTITGTADAPTVISENTATEAGGGIFVMDGATQIDYTTFTKNSSTQGGGAWFQGGTNSLQNAVFSENSAPYGGAIGVGGGSVALTDSTVEKNTSTQYGGGFYIGKGTVTLTGTSIMGNTAVEAGGIASFGTVIMNSGTISNNEAKTAGGVETLGTFTMAGGEISGNKATGTNEKDGEGIGGGVVNIGRFTMNHGKLYGNTAQIGANDFYNVNEEGGVFTLLDSATFNVGATGWYEDAPGKRYDPNGNSNTKYLVVTNDTSEKYLTLGIPDSYGVLYEFKVSVRGAGLIDEIKKMLPLDEETYAMGETVTAIQPERTWLIGKKSINNSTMGLWTFLGYEEDTQIVSAENLESGTDPNDTKRYIIFTGTWKWEQDVPEVLTLTPQEMTAYTGGDSISKDPFPSVRYKITGADDIAGLKFTLDGNTYYPVQSGGYWLLPGIENTFSPADEQQTRAGGDVPDDRTAGVYEIGVEHADRILVEGADGTNYTVEVAEADLDNMTGTLTVRYVSDPEDVLHNVNSVATEIVTTEDAVGELGDMAVAVIPAGATFYTNGAEANLGIVGTNINNPAASPRISLLFDDILVQNYPGGDATVSMMIDRAAEEGYMLEEGNYQFKYLDLVNETDGNAWVSTDSQITIFWPYPDEVAANYNDYTFEVLHFKDLHREYQINSAAEMEEKIALSDVAPVPGVEATANGVKFTLEGNAESGSFSPFALTWALKSTQTDAHKVTLHYESNGGTEYTDERYDRNTVVQLDKVPSREGYTFTGWYADKGLTERITSIKMTSNKTVYAGWELTGVPDWLNGKDHFAYVIGYDDGMVRPLDNISRAEVATIFFRLLKPEVRDQYLTTTNNFTDVNEGDWYNTAISTMTSLGILKGRTDTAFEPNVPITRAEFAVICARFDTSKRDGDSNFTDIVSHWAKAEIERACVIGWLNGYEDGTFRPDKQITRAEAMTMINRVLNRLPETEDDLLPGMNVWTDNQPGTWYYLAVQEATNSHDFTSKNGIHEHWTKLTDDPNWEQYQ